MSNSGKVALHYPSKFWLERGCNGTVFSESGPLRQIWDNSDREKPILCGFLFDQDLDRVQSEEDITRLVLPQLARIFGEPAARPTKISFKSWKNDPFTHVEDPRLDTNMQVHYGDAVVSARQLNDLCIRRRRVNARVNALKEIVNEKREAAEAASLQHTLAEEARYTVSNPFYLAHSLLREMSEIRHAFDSLTPSLNSQYGSTLSSASANSDMESPAREWNVLSRV